MYKRIIILGGSGSGKSTLANRISLHTNYPTYHLDNLLLHADWSQKDKSEWVKICKEEFLLKDEGIVDGNYSFVLEERIRWADLIIFIDIPTYLQLFNVVKRAIKINLGLEKRHGTSKERSEKLNKEFLEWVLHWNKGHRKKMIIRLSSIQNKKVVITNNPRNLIIEKLLLDITKTSPYEEA